MMPGRTNLQLQILIIAIRAVGPAVDVVEPTGPSARIVREYGFFVQL